LNVLSSDPLGPNTSNSKSPVPRRTLPILVTDSPYPETAGEENVINETELVTDKSTRYTTVVVI